MSTETPPGRSYWCFISYRHADNQEPGRQWATWLHQAIETYEVPQDLVGTVNERGDTIPARIFPVFRDEEELPVDAHLESPIYRALDASKFLVVICSPRSFVSTYVGSEIRYFKQLGHGDRVLAVMIEGEPNASRDARKLADGFTASQECFPEALRHAVGPDGTVLEDLTEPIAADFRLGTAQGWTSLEAYRQELRKEGLSPKAIDARVEDYGKRIELMKLKVIAGILGVSLGTLTQRDKAYQLALAQQRARALRRWLAAVALLAFLAIGGGIFAWVQRLEAITQRQLAEEQRREALETASETDFAIADLKLQTDNTPEALAYLARSLKNNPDNRSAATRLLSLCRSLPFCRVRMSHHNIVTDANFSPDGKWVVTSSFDHTAQVWDAQTGEPVGKPIEHKGLVSEARFSPDGKWIVTVSEKTAQVWEARTGQAIGAPMVAGDWMVEANFSPDGKWIVTASNDKTAQIWDAATGQQAGEPMRHEGTVARASFSPDGLWIVTASSGDAGRGDVAQVWDVKTRKPVGAPMRHQDLICSLSFSPEGKRILTSSYDHIAQVWDARTGQPLGAPLKHEAGVNAARFSPDGRWVVTGSWKEALVWDTRTGKTVGEPMKHDSTVDAVNFSPDGKWIVTASSDKTARIWDALTGKPISEPFRHEGNVQSASFSPDGKWVLTGSWDKSARIWAAQASAAVGEPFRQSSEVKAAEFSPEGKRIVTGASDGTVRVWDVASGAAISPPMRHGEALRTVHFSPDGKSVLTASDDKTARIWDATTGQEIGAPMQHDDMVLDASFSPDGTKVITASGDKTARIWDATTGQEIGTPLTQDDYIKSARFSPDGKLVITGAADKTARIWDVQTDKEVGTPLHHLALVNEAAFSPDGKEIVTASVDSTARLWDVQTEKQVGQSVHHEAEVTSAEFSPDGKSIVTASWDNTARVWNAQTGHAVGEPMEHADIINTATFSPDGRWIVTASDDRTARLWDAQTGKPVGEPMRHDTVDKRPLINSNGNWFVNTASFSLDGRWIVTSSNNESARVWESGVVTGKTPEWLMTLAEAIGSRRLNVNWVLDPFDPDLPGLQKELRQLGGDDDLARFGRWFVADPYTRTISPLSAITVPEFVAQRLQENTPASLDEAYRIDPGDPLVVVALARFEDDKEKALFLCRHAFARAQIEGPPEKIERVRTLAQSLFPNLPEFRAAAKVGY